MSEKVDKALQERAGPFPFETPRIQKSDGPRADSSSPNEPISIRKVPQHDVASYALPGKPNRQLTKDDLGSYDFQLLNAIEAVANSLPYLLWSNCSGLQIPRLQILVARWRKPGGAVALVVMRRPQGG